MKNTDYRNTEELLAKRFSGVKKDLKDPGYIAIEYREKETVRGFFGRPAMQLAGALLTAVLVAGLTFFGIKYLERLGASTAGQNTDETRTADTIDERSFYTLDLSTVIGSNGEELPYAVKRLISEHDLNVRVGKYDEEDSNGGTYADFAKKTHEYPEDEGEVLFRIRVKREHDGYENNAVWIKSAAGEDDLVLYVDDTPSGQIVMCYEFKSGLSLPVNTTGLKTVTDGLNACYVYLEYDRPTKTVVLNLLGVSMDCGLPMSNAYDVHLRYCLDLSAGEIKLGDEFTAESAKLPDGASYHIKTISENKEMLLITSYGGDAEGVPDIKTVDGEIPSLYYDNELTMEIEYSKDSAEHSPVSAFVYDGGRNFVTKIDLDDVPFTDVMNYENIRYQLLYLNDSRLDTFLKRRKENTYYIVLRIKQGSFTHDFVFNIYQWSFETYDIDASLIPDDPDLSAPVYFTASSDCGSASAPAQLVEVRSGAGEVFFSDGELPNYVPVLKVKDETSVEFRYDENVKLISAYLTSEFRYGSVMAANSMEELESMTALVKDTDGWDTPIVCAVFSQTSQLDGTVYTYSVRLQLNFTDTDVDSTEPPEKDGDYPIYLSVTYGKRIYPKAYLLWVSQTVIETGLTGDGDGPGAYGAENVPVIEYYGKSYGREMTFEYDDGIGHPSSIRITVGGEEKQFRTDEEFIDYLDTLPDGTYRVVISATFRVSDDKYEISGCYEYPFDIKLYHGWETEYETETGTGTDPAETTGAETEPAETTAPETTVPETTVPETTVEFETETGPHETTAPETGYETEEGPVWDPDQYGELIYVMENGETVSNLSFANVRFLQTDQTMQGRRDTLIYYADDLTVTAAEGVSVRKIKTCLISATARYKTVYYNTLDELNGAIRNGAQLDTEGIHIEIEAESDMFYASYVFDVQYGTRGKPPVYLSVSNGRDRVYPQSYLVNTEETDENGGITGDGDVVMMIYKNRLSLHYSNYNVYRTECILYDGPEGEIITSSPTENGINNYLDNAAPGTYRLVIRFVIRGKQGAAEYEYALDVIINE